MPMTQIQVGGVLKPRSAVLGRKNLRRRYEPKSTFLACRRNTLFCCPRFPDHRTGGISVHAGLLRDGIAKGGVASWGYLIVVGRGRILQSHLLVGFVVLS